MGKNYDLYDNPRADANEKKKLSKKSMSHSIRQKMLVLQTWLLKYQTIE
jgi:hypothetical protein